MVGMQMTTSTGQILNKLSPTDSATGANVRSMVNITPQVPVPTFSSKKPQATKDHSNDIANVLSNCLNPSSGKKQNYSR